MGLSVSQSSSKDLSYVLAHHDSQINMLAGRISNLESKLDGILHSLSKVTHALTLQEARPAFNVHQTLQVVLMLIGIAGASVTGITFIVKGTFADTHSEFRERNAAIELRLKRVEQLEHSRLSPIAQDRR